MPAPLLPATPLPDSFSTRRHLALQRKGKRPSPTALEREFNLRWRGVPITVTATRKWLLGLAVPTLDKLRVLALWLDVSEEWLRWGVDHEMEAHASNPHLGLHATESTRVGSRKGAGTATGRSPEETSLIQDYRMLQPQDKQVVRAIVEVLLRERRLKVHL